MPPRFTLGETLTLTRTLADYPASAGWVLRFRLLPRDGSGGAVEFAAAASGDDHVVAVDAATTAAWTAGTFTWYAWAELVDAVHGVDRGVVELLPDPRAAATGPLDLRSAAQIALDNVRATLRGRASADVLRYTINGRSLEHHSVSELILLEAKLARDVAAELRAAGGPDMRRIAVRVGRG